VAGRGVAAMVEALWRVCGAGAVQRLLAATFVQWSQKIPLCAMEEAVTKLNEIMDKEQQAQRQQAAMVGLATCPSDLVGHICSYLNGVEVLRLEQVSRQTLFLVEQQRALKRLHVRSDQIEHVPVFRLRHLQYLEVEITDINDLSVLQDVPSLKRWVCFCLAILREMGQSHDSNGG